MESETDTEISGTNSILAWLIAQENLIVCMRQLKLTIFN
jgi:hypothetical protein